MKGGIVLACPMASVGTGEEIAGGLGNGLGYWPGTGSIWYAPVR